MQRVRDDFSIFFSCGRIARRFREVCRPGLLVRITPLAAQRPGGRRSGMLSSRDPVSAERRFNWICPTTPGPVSPWVGEGEQGGQRRTPNDTECLVPGSACASRLDFGHECISIPDKTFFFFSSPTKCVCVGCSQLHPISWQSATLRGRSQVFFA